MQLFDPYFNGQYKIQSSLLNYHIRGNTSRRYVKKSYKLSLIDENGINDNLNLLGIHKDDDWIINSLYSDDEKIREKLLQDIWNQLVSSVSKNNAKMKFASTDFVEVLIDNEYRGLYALGTRIDTKYLGLIKENCTIFRLRNILLFLNRIGVNITEETYNLGPFYIVSSPDILESWKKVQVFSRVFLQNDYPTDYEDAKKKILILITKLILTSFVKLPG